MVADTGLEPARVNPTVFKTVVSTIPPIRRKKGNRKTDPFPDPFSRLKLEATHYEEKLSATLTQRVTLAFYYKGLVFVMRFYCVFSAIRATPLE